MKVQSAYYQRLNSMKNNNLRRVATYVEFGLTGHRGVWMRGVVEAFKNLGSGWQLNIWVPKAFLHDHKELCSDYLNHRNVYSSNIFFKTHDQANEHPALLKKFEVIKRCVLEDNADVCFIALELDSCLKEIAFSRRDACKAKIIGIRRGPFLHYLKFTNPARRRGLSIRMYFREYLLNFLVAHRRTVGDILCLDPLAPAFYNAILGTSKFRYLPSDVMQIEHIPDMHQDISLPKDRDIVLFTGMIDKRKGTLEFLLALENAFERNADFQSQVAVVFAGLVTIDVKDAFYEAISHLKAAYPDSMLLIYNRYLTDQEYISLILASSVVCIPYVKFVGMSGVLIHAANYGCLVLASQFGLIGELVQRYDLGVVCDESNPAELADALCRCVEESRCMTTERREKMQSFATRFSVSLRQFGEKVCASVARSSEV